MSGTGHRRVAIAIAGILLAGLSVSGCAPLGLLAGAGLAGGVAQERSTRDQLDDLEIGLRIQNALSQEPGALFASVDLEVVEGRVLLAGAVPRPEDRIRAVEIAWATPQVHEVVNEIEVAQGGGIQGYARDAWISTQVRTRLIGAPGVNALNFNVDTVGGVVHLIGLARGPDELRRATQAAAAVPGAQRVVSHVLFIDDPRRKPATRGPAPSTRLTAS